MMADQETAVERIAMLHSIPQSPLRYDARANVRLIQREKDQRINLARTQHPAHMLMSRRPQLVPQMLTAQSMLLNPLVTATLNDEQAPM